MIELAEPLFECVDWLGAVAGTAGRTHQFRDETRPPSHRFIEPELERSLALHRIPAGSRALDFGCGNGLLSAWLAGHGMKVVGVDPSETGVAIARAATPSATFSSDVSAENIAALGPFDLAISIEVLCHCYEPEEELSKIFAALEPGGVLLLATPYYGYPKTLALALSGKLQDHLTNLFGPYYTRLYSPSSIKRAMGEVGFERISIRRLGRIPPLAMTMLVTAWKPA